MAAHAKLSASGAHRWLRCPGSVAAEATIPDTTSDYAREGSAAHALAEMCLTTGDNADIFVGAAPEAYPDIPVTAEMADAVQAYVDYVRGLTGERFIEQRVDFSPWVPEGFGTVDAIVIDGDTLIVIDLKYGQGVRVDAEDNPQAKLYALGAVNDYGFIYPVANVRCVIVQPRLDHISEWDITRKQLERWGEEIRPKAERALSENAPFHPSEAACRFCRAKATCRALAEANLKTAANDFATVEKPIEPKAVDGLSPDEIAAILPQLDLITGWIKAVKEHAIGEIEHGRAIPGHKLVAGRSLRQWDDAEAAEAALRAVKKLKVADIFTKKLISPSQAEKLLGKKHKLLAEHVVKPQGKPTLAPETDSRPALAPDVEHDFEQVA
jgi:hypothetical protein